MNIFDFIQNNGEKEIPNPKYNKKSKKNTEPPTIKVPDINPTMSQAVNMAIVDYNNQYSINSDENEKYRKLGLNYNNWENLDQQLAKTQSNASKVWNSVNQTLWSEIALGTVKGFADLWDVITGAVLDSDNDYQNPVSAYLEKVQEDYRNNNPIYADPDKSLTTGGLTDVGWWASNFPSVASSLTLLIPSTGLTRGLSYLGKALKVGKGVAYGRKALLSANGIAKIRAHEQLGITGKIGRWANRKSTVTAANRMIENGLTAAGMRTMENYQEARQTYNDMYKEASESLRNMTDIEYAAFLERNKDELANSEVDTNDRDAVARAISHNAATKTFMIDYGNIIFDVAQVYALGNPLKLAKNMRETSAVRRADRLARRNAGKSAEEIAKLDASETFRTKTKNWFSDHIADGKIMAAESSESVEEALNYIAQQEGMNYGRLMIDPKHYKNRPLASRLASYLASPELHDAAFWGLMGGVMFQFAGSGFNRVKNAVSTKIEENKKHNDKTKEGKQSSWRELFETTENKTRLAEVKARDVAQQDLVDQLTLINEGKDPFNNDPNNPEQKAKLNSDIEIQLARDRAIDEYIVGMTFRAISAGNYDMLRAYLQDENVRKALADKGIIDNSNIEGVEKLIQRMDEVAEIYEDNLIMLDDLSQEFGDVPFEYLEIIGRDNAVAQIQLQRLDGKITAYQTSADKNKQRFGNNLSAYIDYQAAVELVVIARKLGMLRAQEKEILADKEYAKSLDGQNELKDIRNNIKLINEQLYSEQRSTTGRFNTFRNRLATVLWANGISTKGYLTDRGEYKHDNNSKEYNDFLDALLRRDFKALSELTSLDLQVDDESIMALFGEDGKSGAYAVLSQDLNEAFDVERGIEKNAPGLNSDYINIAALKLAKITQETRIANTSERISHEINKLHNSMLEARKKAIAEAESTIFDLGKKYGSIDVMTYIFENSKIDTITDEDKAALDSALEVLNLTNDANRDLGENLRWTLINAELQAEATNAIQNQGNSTSQQAPSAPQNGQTTNPSTQPQQSNTGQQNGQNGQQTAPQAQPTQPTQQGQTNTPTTHSFNVGDKVIWSNANGTYSFVAEIEALEPGTATIRNLTTGDITSVSIGSLTKVNQPATGRLRIKPNINGGIDVETGVPSNEVGYDYVENPDGTLSLLWEDGTVIPSSLLADSNLYEGFDLGKDRNSADYKRNVVEHPRLRKDNNGHYSIESKGKIRYQPIATPQTNPSTGVGVNPNASTFNVGDKVTYTNKSGNYSFEAEVVEINGNDITIKNLKNGNTTKTTADRLTKTNQTAPVSQTPTAAPTQSPTPTPAPAPSTPATTAPAANPAETVAPVSLTDEQIEEIENNIQGEFNEIFRNRDKSRPIAEVLNEATEQVRQNHTKDENQDVIKNAIFKAKMSIARRAVRSGLIKEVAEVLSSSVTEMPNGKYDFSKEYKEAVVKMLVAYCKENGIREINGKYYINLEDTLRRINTVFEDKVIADMMFGAINAYLKTEDAKKQFVVMDNTTNVEEFLANVKKTTAQRIEEKIGTRDGKSHRVSIDRLFENPSKEFLDAFNSIEKNDVLGIKVENGEIKLTKNDVVIGTLPRPLVDAKDGSYYKYNNGWKTDVRMENGKITSYLRDLFELILTESDPNLAEVNDAITELNYGDPTKERREELINYIYTTLDDTFGLVKDHVLASDVDKDVAIGYLAKLWKYYDTRNDSPGKRNADISDSLDLWFKKMYDSYDSINQLNEILANNPDAVKVVVDKITSGEIIRIVEGDTKGKKENYDKFTQVNKALANPKEVKLGIVNPDRAGELTTTTGETIQHDTFSKSGVPIIVISDKSGLDQYVSGTSIAFNDNHLTGDARELFKAIRRELDWRVDKLIKEGDYNSFYDFIHELLYTTNDKGTAQGITPNTGILRGISFKHANKSKFGFNISANGITLQTHNIPNKKSFSFKYQNDEDYTKNLDLNDEEDAKTFKKVLNDIISNATFNIAQKYITGKTASGFATVTSDGRFQIAIPNSANPKENFVRIYGSFKDAVFEAGLIRVNTKMENGSNFRRKGKKQAANQILEVSLVKTTSPVEESQSEGTPTTSKAEQILTDDEIKDKATELIKDSFTEEQLNSLKDLHLLPENVIFDENFNTKNDNGNWEGRNAAARLKTGETLVGRRWLNMFNEEGEFAGYAPGEFKRQAIRKLIHEQLHHKLEEAGRQEYLKKIEEIYNDFEAALANADEATRKELSKYLFNTPDEEGKIPAKHVRLEEFLVESLTSGELVNYLNSVKVETKDGKFEETLWSKILNLLSDIFGWKVEKGSLREKELQLLQNEIEEIQQGIKVETETKEKENKPKPKKKVKSKENETPSLFDWADQQLEQVREGLETITEQPEVQEETKEEKVEEATKETKKSRMSGAFKRANSNKKETRGSSITESVNNYTPEMNDIKTRAIGEFSTTNDDIRYSEVTEQISTPKNQKVMREEVEKFLSNFDITLNDVNDFGGEVKLFDALNRTINIRSIDDISEGVGQAIAFMMQYDNTMLDLYKYTLKTSTSFGQKGVRRSINVRGDVDPDFNLRGVSRKSKQEFIEAVGKDIANELRKLYNVEPINVEPNSYFEKLWNIIAAFFDKLTPKAKNKFNVLKSYTKSIAEGIKRNDVSVLNISDNKPGTIGKAERVDIFKALEEHPYESSIIETLTKEGIALGGSASIAVEGSLYRPSENPLHDIDFEAPGFVKEDIDNIINTYYPNNKHIRTIKENNDTTETYLILDRPFTIKEGLVIEGEKETFVGIYDAKTNELIGYYLKSELILKDNIKGKFLDFFTGESASKFPNTMYTIDNKSYLISDARSAFSAKVTWQREKDIWDYNKFKRNDKDNIRYSSTTEAPVQHPSIAAFTETLPLDQQAEFMRSVARGEISTACR